MAKKKAQRAESFIVSFKVDGAPMSLNDAYPTNRNGRRYLTDEGKNYKYNIGLIAKTSINEDLEGPYEVSIHFYFKNKCRRDIDNFAKLILDALTKIAWKDDSEVHALHLYKNYNDSPYFNIQIKQWNQNTK